VSVRFYKLHPFSYINQNLTHAASVEQISKKPTETSHPSQSAKPSAAPTISSKPSEAVSLTFAMNSTLVQAAANSRSSSTFKLEKPTESSQPSQSAKPSGAPTVSAKPSGAVSASFLIIVQTFNYPFQPDILLIYTLTSQLNRVSHPDQPCLLLIPPFQPNHLEQ